MLGAPPSSDYDFSLYAALLRRLHLLMADGKTDSPEADALRDAMDAPWQKMSDEQIAKARGLSADLYSLEDPPVSPPQVSEDVARQALESIQTTFLQGRWEDLLKLLRSAAQLLPQVEVAILRGAAWHALRDTATAQLFYEGAGRRAVEYCEKLVQTLPRPAPRPQPPGPKGELSGAVSRPAATERIRRRLPPMGFTEAQP